MILFDPAIIAVERAIVGLGNKRGIVDHEFGAGWCKMVWREGLTVISDPFRIITKLADFIVLIQNGAVFLRLATKKDNLIDIIYPPRVRVEMMQSAGGL